jgi:two-component system response regulator MprA
LVAEDDDTLGAVLAQGLRSRGYVVDLVADGEAALSYARCYEYAVAVLDWLIPRVSGIDVVRQLRRTGARTPVLMISGKGAPEDRVAGLDAGADDYLVKPFAADELTARLRALLRRGQAEGVVSYGDLSIDPATRVAHRGDTALELTAREADLLLLLLRNAGRVVSRQQALHEVWGGGRLPTANTVDRYVAYLRAKLGPPPVIHTVRGVGFQLRR